MQPQPRIGGTFAPPLTDEKLAAYKTAISAMPAGAVRDALATLMHCCNIWWELPESNGTAKTPHPSGVGTITALQADHVKTLDDSIPWGHELDAIQTLFDGLPDGAGAVIVDEDGRRRSIIEDKAAKATRDMAFHLLWVVRELNLGREPLTNDRL